MFHHSMPFALTSCLALSMLVVTGGCSTSETLPTQSSLAGDWDCIGGLSSDSMTYWVKARMSFEHLDNNRYDHTAQGQASIEGPGGETSGRVIYRQGLLTLTDDSAILEIHENWQLTPDMQKLDGDRGDWSYEIRLAGDDLVMIRSDDPDSRGKYTCTRRIGEKSAVQFESA